MMAENTKFLFAISFLLLSIFATYCPIPRLFSHVKAAERREALCREHGEGYYYDSGQGRCISCDIPCKSSNESCREHGCFDYYFNVKSKKELCKPDEFYEKSIERCRPCSIPCSVNDKLCQDMGCKISSPLPTPNLPPTTTPPDNSGPPILTKTTSAPDSNDSTGSTMWMASVIPIIALLIIIVVTVICCRKKQIGNWFVQKYRNLGAENNYNQCQKIFLNNIIKKCCHAKYTEIIEARNNVNMGPASPEEEPFVPPRVDGNQVVDTGHHSAAADKSSEVAGDGLNVLQPSGSILSIDHDFAEPKFEISPRYREPLQAKVGGVVKIPVSLRGTPAPKIEWSKNGRPLRSRDNVTVYHDDHETVVTIRDVKKGDAGEYTLVAHNDVGDSMTTFKVNVVDTPSAPAGPLFIRNAQRDAVMVEWQPPKQTNGAPISSYLIEKRDTKCAVWSKVGTCSPKKNQYLVTGLQEGSEYFFRVKAENEIGYSDALEVERPVMAKSPYDVPSVPLGPLRTSDITKNSINLEWQPVESDGGQPIKSYVIEKCEVGRDRLKWDKIAAVKPSVTSFTAGDLAEGYSYKFRVLAQNAEGFSAPLEVERPVAVHRPPEPPTGPVGVTDLHENKATISWMPPHDDGGSPITSYRIEQSRDGYDWSNVATVDSGVRHYNVADLREGKDYYFRVIAENQVGQSQVLESDRIVPKKKIGNDQSDAGTADVGNLQSDNNPPNHKESLDVPDGDPEYLRQTQDPTKPSIKSQQSHLNKKMGLSLDQSIRWDQFKKLKDFFEGDHGVSDVRALEKAESATKLIDLLIRNKKIKMGEPDGYGPLIEALRLIGEDVLAEEVTNTQSLIANAGNPPCQSTE